MRGGESAQREAERRHRPLHCNATVTKLFSRAADRFACTRSAANFQGADRAEPNLNQDWAVENSLRAAAPQPSTVSPRPRALAPPAHRAARPRTPLSDSTSRARRPLRLRSSQVRCALGLPDRGALELEPRGSLGRCLRPLAARGAAKPKGAGRALPLGARQVLSEGVARVLSGEERGRRHLHRRNVPPKTRRRRPTRME